jgi:O-6-methylguanine DNA methyltransferase
VTRFVVGLVDSPLGPLEAALTDDGLAALEFADGPRAAWQRRRVERALHVVAEPAEALALLTVAEAVAAFFVGADHGLPLAPVGTPFQLRCWAWLATIPRGETRSYAAAAAALGTSPRAFARANGANPIALLIPCHRVIGSDGALTGYGGGLPRKRALLRLEAGREAEQLPALQLDGHVALADDAIVEGAQRERAAVARPGLGEEFEQLQLARLVGDRLPR